MNNGDAMSRRSFLAQGGLEAETAIQAFRAGFLKAKTDRVRTPNYRDYAEADLATQQWLDEITTVTETVKYNA